MMEGLGQRPAEIARHPQALRHEGRADEMPDIVPVTLDFEPEDGLRIIGRADLAMHESVERRLLLVRARQRDDAIGLAAVRQRHQGIDVIADGPHADAILDMRADVVVAVDRDRLDVARRERHRGPGLPADQLRGQGVRGAEAEVDHLFAGALEPRTKISSIETPTSFATFLINSILLSSSQSGWPVASS